MYGATGKMGRGGGGSGGKRNIHAPPIGRPTPAGRTSMGGGPRGRGAAASSPSTSSLQVEESFSLVRENPLNFGMAIKLAPDLVEEIKREEAQGGTARIKFGANATGNVIHVGDKTFKFSWSREPGDLCDIYEERQSGDGGNGLLVESGGTWRKLNVERELDESTKNHVKRRSEEAERKSKSRKAIVLDHQNPAMKNQMKAFAASESNQWRNSKNRKEPPFKKQKSEPTSAVGPPKSVYKPGLPIPTLSKGRLSTGSPLSSQPEQLGPSSSPIGNGDLVKGQTIVSDISTTQNLNKVSSSEKDIANRKINSISDKSKHRLSIEAKPADLRSLIISLLTEHQSTGMSLKALEKAIGDVMPNSARKIEPILKQIANYQAPGRYHLKPGIEMESSKKLPQTQIGSSPEINRNQSPALQKFDHLPVQDPIIPMRPPPNNEEQCDPTPAHTTNITEKIDILHNSPENLSDKNVPRNSEGVAGSSSDSGSDSDSESNSSDSKSKSRSPAGSPSVSSSESDTDSSSSSKQASDEDVDIMTSDDEKESKLNPRSNLDSEYVDIGNSENQDHHLSDDIEIDIEKDSPENDLGVEMPAPNHLSANKESEEIKASSADRYEQQEIRGYDRKAYDDGSRGNSKRPFDDKHSSELTHSKKRSKSKNSVEPVSGTINSLFGESPYNSSPDRPMQGADKRPSDLIEPSGEKRPGEYNSLNGLVNERRQSKLPAEIGDKHAPIVESSHNRKSEMARKMKESGERSPVMNGRVGVLRREYSDLELGELREPFNDETPSAKKKFERKSSSKHLENKQMDIDYWNSDFGGKTSSKIPTDSVKPSPPNSDGPYKKKSQENYFDDRTRPHQRSTRPIDHQPSGELNSQKNTIPEMNCKTGFTEAGEETNRKIPANSTEQQHDPIRGVGVDPRPTKQSKKQKPIMTGVSNDRRVDALTASNNRNQNKKSSSPDETISSFTKFEKEKPELKSPIRDLSQYKEYVKEYQEKYESYCSLNKILESYRDEFSKLGKDLETYKGRDMKRYNDILEQMRSSFRQCGEKHKRLKKIFVVLYEELKHLKQMIKDYAASLKKD